MEFEKHNNKVVLSTKENNFFKNII